MTVIKIGMSGPNVCDLQQMLNLKVAEPPLLKVDGIFGPKTKARVVKFQAGNRLVADGIVGPLTSKALVGAVLIATLQP
jgi:peptidoglycan hydrolase-like protein with peptidoglycan-binding domain